LRVFFILWLQVFPCWRHLLRFKLRPPVDGAAATALAQRSACMACHAVDRRLVGPTYRAIAAKHKGMEVAKLAASIRAGGSGKWGPMSAQPNLSEENARILAAWILAGAPAN